MFLCTVLLLLQMFEAVRVPVYCIIITTNITVILLFFPII